MSVDLLEIPTSELVDELQSRSLASVIVLTMPDSGETSNTRTWYSGNDFTLLGLSEASAYRMRRKIYNDLEPGQNED